MTAAAANKPVTLTRDDLYAQVWTTPMHRLGARYGISGNGLAKICRRLAIPYPPRGYWARKAAGQKLAQTPLPAIRAGAPAQVTITPSLPPPPPPQMSPELHDALAAARRLTAGLSVPTKLLHPHRIVAGWIEERRRWREQAKRDPWYRGSPLPADFSAMERRRHRILSVLFVALEKHGYTAKVDERGRTAVEIDHEPAAFTLREKHRQVRRPLTEAEKKDGFNPKRPWKQEVQPTGLLQLTIETRLHPALAHAWIDAPEQSLEQQLPEIAAVFVAAAPLLQERRRQYEEAERRRRDEELRRYEEQRRRQLEGNRLRGFLDLAARWKEAEAARLFLDALAARAAADGEQIIGDRTLAQWIAWARDRLAAHDPLTAGAVAVFEAIAAVDHWTYREVRDQASI